MAKSVSGSGGKKGKKNRKHLRHKMRSPSAKAYSAEGRSLKNKVKRVAKHKKLHPNDKQNVLTNVDYKIKRLKPEEQAELNRIRQWKCYLKGVA